MILALALAAASVSARVDAVAAQAKLAGVVLVGKGDRVLVERGYGTVDPAGGKRNDPRARWRLASITKQVAAAMVVRRHPGDLDRPLGTQGFAPLGGLTLRQLLTHHTGLANPDDTPLRDGVPSFYRAPAPDRSYCLTTPPKPGAPFAYNNCDYLMAVVGMYGSGALAWPAEMAMARTGEMGVPGFVAGKAEPRYELASFGAAGGLIGTARAVFRFDRSLMTGKLMTPAARAELWKPEGGRSYQALGQWVFPGQLKGCAAPKRIVQRDGEIGGVQTRNYILPDDDIAVVVFTNRSSDDFAFGEIWQKSGFAYDLLSTVACP